MLLLYHSNLNQIAFKMRFFLGIILLLLPGFVLCAEWSLKSSIDQFLGYDTNVRMQEQAQGSFFYKIIPVLTLSHKTDFSEIKADALYGTQIYTDVTGFDQDIQNYTLSGTYKTQQIDWGLVLNHSATPQRNNALQNSGAFASNSVNITQSVSPSLTYHVNEINSLILTPSYSTTSFSNADINTFRNYENLTINLAWQHAWTERYSTSLSPFYSKFKSNGTSALSSINYSSYGINFSNSYNLSEQWQLSGTVGIRQTDTSGSSTNSSSQGFLADLSANYTGDNISSGVSFRRSLAPSSFGRLQEQTDLSWTINYKIAERLSTNFNIYYLESTQVNLNTQGTRKNIVIQPGINWNISPEWTLSGSYRYRSQDRNQDDSGNIVGNNFAESHLIMFTINYKWQGLSISR